MQWNRIQSIYMHGSAKSIEWFLETSFIDKNDLVTFGTISDTQMSEISIASLMDSCMMTTRWLYMIVRCHKREAINTNDVQRRETHFWQFLKSDFHNF
jgi:hypothetical protein